MADTKLFDRWSRPKRVVIPENPDFGTPTLEAGGVGKASWSRDLTPGTQRVAWSAKLEPGIQTGWNDYAKVIVPVNEMRFDDLDSVRLETHYTAATGADMAVCLYMHNPENFDDHIELSHTPLNNTVAGHRELNFPTEPGGSSWGWYGTVSGTPNTCPSDWDTSSYTWAQFKADSVFGTWTIYRISFDYGYQTSDIVLGIGYLCQARINDVVIPLEPSPMELVQITLDTQAEATRTLPTWKFGEPTLRASNDASAVWSRWQHQQTHTGWTAKLHGGDQSTWSDWAKICVPVNELPLNELESALWAWYNTEEEYSGLAMQIHIHDPDDNDLRVDMSQAGGDMLDKGAGWCAHELAMVNRFAWYGEDGPSAGSAITEGALVFLSEFLIDPLFSKWTIYRIDFYWGAIGNSQEYKDIWVSNIKINGEVIPLKPDSTGTGRIGYKYETAATGNIATVCAPKTPFRLLNVMLHLDGAATANTFTLTCDAGRGATFDTKLYSKPMAGVQDVVIPFGEGYEFIIDDEIDAAWTNSGTIDWGITFAYQTVF